MKESRKSMGDDNAQDNNFEIEITDLRTGARIDRPSLSNSPSSNAAPHPGASPSPTVASLAHSPSPRVPLRRRPRRQLIGAGAVSALVLLVFAYLLTNGRSLSATIGLPFSPAATATIAPDADTVYFTHLAPWGYLSIDNQPRFNPLQENTAYALPAGSHTIEYTAQPFADLSCTLSVPAAHSDTCPLYQPDSNITPNPLPPAPARLIDLRIIPERLPADQAQALRAAIEGLLTRAEFTTLMLPGDHYATPDGKTAIASQPTPTTIAYILQNSNFNDEQCSPFCSDGVQFGSASSPDAAAVWHIGAAIAARWYYAPYNGPRITAPSPESQQEGAGIPLDIGVTWAGAWQIHLTPADVTSFLCGDGARFIPPPTQSQQGLGSTTSGTLIAANPADGCLIGVYPPDNSAYTPSPTQTTLPVAGYLLYHFGVLVACDPATHKLLPSLPTASAHEAAIARQILANQPPQP